MKKILTSLIAILLLAVPHLKAEDRVIIVKPIGVTTITTTNWGGADAVDEEKYIMQKVEGEDNLYMCSITLDKYFKTDKWKTYNSDEYDPENPEGWSDEYKYHVVYQDGYSTNDGIVAASNKPKPFKVDADGTTVTFYARLVQDGDYKNSGDAVKWGGKIRSVCDAQTLDMRIWGRAPHEDYVIPNGIGKESAYKEVFIWQDSQKREVTLYSAELGGDWQDLISDQGIGKHVVATRGRHIVNLNYETIKYSIDKVLDETDNPKLKVGVGEHQDAENFTGDQGIFGSGIPFLLTASIDGKTTTEYNTKIDTETVSAYFCYKILSDDQTNSEVNRITLTTEAAQTDHATWTSEATNITEGLPEGEYSIKVWYELITGVDTLRNDNDGNGYVATFSVSNEPIFPSLNLEMYVDGGFETLCLPFTVTEMKDSEGNLVSPAQLLEYTANEGEVVYFSETNTIQANTPYLIALPEEEGTNKKQITFLGTTAETANPVVNRGNYSFRGTYTTYEETTDPDYYVLNGTGDSFVKAIEETFVPANRAYFKAINPASHSTLKVDTDGTTNVKLIADEVNGIVIYSIGNGIKIIADRAAQINLYSIDGRLVRKTDIIQGENSIEGLLKGIYIVNNQKVVVK